MSNDSTSVAAAVRRLSPRREAPGYRAPNSGGSNPGDSVHSPRFRTNNVAYVSDVVKVSFSDSSTG